MNYVILTTAREHELCVFHIVQDEYCELSQRSKILGYAFDSTHITKGPNSGPIITGRSVYSKRDDAWAHIEDFLYSSFVNVNEILFVGGNK